MYQHKIGSFVVSFVGNFVGKSAFEVFIMLCLAALFGQANIPTSNMVRVVMRAELSGKLLCRLNIKRDWTQLGDLSVFLQRQGAQVLGNTKPFAFLRVKFGGTVVSSLFGDNPYGFYLRGDQMGKLMELTEAREALVDLFWELDGYERLCCDMHKTLDSCDYKLVNQQAVLEVRVKPKTSCCPDFVMPFRAYKFRAEQLVVWLGDVLVDSRGFKALILRDKSIKVLKLYGGEYRNTGPYVTVEFECLEELHVEGNDLEMTSFPFWIATLTLLRLRIVNFKLSEVPVQLKHTMRLVELDLSNNDLKELPDWINMLTKLETLVLCNNPRLSGRIALNLKKLTKLDVRKCGFAHADLDNLAKSSTKLIILS